MPGRRVDSAPSSRWSVTTVLGHRPSRPAGQIAVLAFLLGAVVVVVVLVNRPDLAIAMYALIPIVLGVHWFGLRGGLVVAAAATLAFVAAQLFHPSTDLTGGDLWVAALNRSVAFVGVAVLVSLLLDRERALAGRVRAQQDEIAELESLRAALTPSGFPERPQLEFATSFTPADGLVAGDFFLVVEGPTDSTTIAVGDVVGHGLEAARCAAFVRAALATFARFTRDPVELLQLANAALVEHGKQGAQFVTAVCLNIGPPPAPEVTWATAGHEVPWFLDTGTPLPGGQVGAPLGVGAEALRLRPGRAALAPGGGILVFTDGLTEGRPVRRRDLGGALELFGEERARRVIQELDGAHPARVLESLVAAVTSFSGGTLADDLCLVAVRAEGRPPAVAD
ncbi:serine/threonine-protein phosphatase [Blastococcus sp. CT_GayMR19]|uniref:PP2C family protein-serine/threonine phosphatase n=1 Tax=Blastococcus sp. CT_GayMR19 TaxID=2559608 RepID=UPI001072F43D|nr:PP2C family protein-serine/threonine phosphatase [Blastococcus sp. CT_GayMR19]TFV74998.1 serine/threonine-protein phosphatase [Blastococcus sp. CT_GayMR19]